MCLRFYLSECFALVRPNGWSVFAYDQMPHTFSSFFAYARKTHRRACACAVHTKESRGNNNNNNDNSHRERRSPQSDVGGF